MSPTTVCLNFSMNGHRTMPLEAYVIVLLSTNRSPRKKVLLMIQKMSNLKTDLFADKICMKAAEKRSESGRTRGATLRGLCLSLLVALLVSGCAAVYSPAPLPVNHPANPAAPEAPPPPPSQAFRDESLPPVLTEEAPVQDPHASHGMIHGGHR